jgi:hypothetical protein
MSFPRHKEIFRSDGGKIKRQPGRDLGGRPRPHRLDEFPTGYSLAGCAPAEPASASPVEASMMQNNAVAKHFPANGNLSLISLSQSRGAVHCSVSPCGGPFRFEGVGNT